MNTLIGDTDFGFELDRTVLTFPGDFRRALSLCVDQYTITPERHDLPLDNYVSFLAIQMTNLICQNYPVTPEHNDETVVCLANLEFSTGIKSTLL